MTGRRENIFRNVASGVSSVAEAMRQLRELHSAELGDTDPAEVAATATANGCVVVRRELLQWLTRGFSAVTGFGLEAIDANESFDRYGIDSIAVVKLNVVFAERFPNLAKTVLYEYPSLNELCDFLLEQESVSPRSLSVGAESAAAQG